MHRPINICLVILPAFLFLFTASLQGQPTGLHLQLEQGISALNDFNMKKAAGAFGGYAAGLGGEYRFRSGLYIKADAQLISTRLEFFNRPTPQQSIGQIVTDIDFYNIIGLVNAKEYRFAYGVGIATNWRKVRFALDLAHSIEFHQRAQTSIPQDSLLRHFPPPTISQYGEVFAPHQRNLRIVNNSAHQLQLSGSVLVEFSLPIGLGLFYRTDLLNRWVDLQAERNLGQKNFSAMQRIRARQAIVGLRLTYAFGQQ